MKTDKILAISAVVIVMLSSWVTGSTIKQQNKTILELTEDVLYLSNQVLRLSTQLNQSLESQLVMGQMVVENSRLIHLDSTFQIATGE